MIWHSSHTRLLVMVVAVIVASLLLLQARDAFGTMLGEVLVPH